MNIEKELMKRQKRSDSYKERYERFNRKQERRNKNRERIEPIKNWWYSLNRKARYQRQIRRICREIIPVTKRTYLNSLIRDSSPNIHFPIFVGRSTAFHPDDYPDGFRLERYLTYGFSHKKKKKVDKCLRMIEKFGFTLDGTLLKDLRATLEKRYGKDYQVTPIQYEYVKDFSKEKPKPYFILSIKGPHPRKKL